MTSFYVGLHRANSRKLAVLKGCGSGGFLVSLVFRSANRMNETNRINQINPFSFHSTRQTKQTKQTRETK